MCACASCPAEERHPGCVVEETCQLLNFRLTRPNNRRRGGQPLGDIGVDLHERNVAGNDDDRDTAFGYRHPDRSLENLRQLRGIGNEFDIMAAVLEYGFRVGSLKVVDSYLGAWDVCGNSQNRYAAALAIEQAVDQMQVSRAAAAGADRKASGEMGLCSRCESGSLFVPHVDPVNRLSPSQCVGKAVERVADNPINPLHSSLLKCFDKELCCRLAHRDFSFMAAACTLTDGMKMSAPLDFAAFPNAIRECSPPSSPRHRGPCPPVLPWRCRPPCRSPPPAP